MAAVMASRLLRLHEAGVPAALEARTTALLLLRPMTAAMAMKAAGALRHRLRGEAMIDPETLTRPRRRRRRAALSAAHPSIRLGRP